jgi:UDP-glucose 4-epimerase
VAVKVHVTGGKGFLGRYIAEALASASFEVEISDVDTLDVVDLAATVARMQSSKPDVVCHLAGLTGAGDSLKNPQRFFEVNCGGTVNVLEACRRAEVPGFVFLSSLTVHGQTTGGDVDEDSTPAPRHPYAGSKAAAEQVVETYARCYGMQIAILRPTLIAGEGQKEPNAISEFAETILSGEEIDIFGDGAHKREWLHPKDVGESVMAAVRYVAAATEPCAETFIISSGEPVSMAELARKVIAQIGKGAVKFTPSNRQAFNLCTKSHKARELLGWAPAIGVDDIIRRVLAAGPAIRP